MTIAVIICTPYAIANIKEDNAHDSTREKEKFAKKMQTKHGLDSEEVLSYLNKAQRQQSVLNIMSHQPEVQVDWLAYKKRFINRQHIKNGKKFISQNKEVLDKVYDIYGVPAEVITAIIGVETNYGQLYGLYRTMDVLVTIAFSDFRRATFFREQLEEFILLANEQDKDPFSYKSSYAGAMGYGQFLPSSYRDYGVDFDNNGVVELESNVEDAIASIANYLNSFGWQKDQPIALAADMKSKGRTQFKPKFNNSLTPNITIKKAKRRYGISPLEDSQEDSWSNNDKITLLKFIGEEPELWMGMDNYYVLSRYNPSYKYVMVLYLLIRSIS